MPRKWHHHNWTSSKFTGLLFASSIDKAFSKRFTRQRDIRRWFLASKVSTRICLLFYEEKKGPAKTQSARLALLPMYVLSVCAQHNCMLLIKVHTISARTLWPVRCYSYSRHQKTLKVSLRPPWPTIIIMWVVACKLENHGFFCRPLSLHFQYFSNPWVPDFQV